MQNWAGRSILDCERTRFGSDIITQDSSNILPGGPWSFIHQKTQAWNISLIGLVQWHPFLSIRRAQKWTTKGICQDDKAQLDPSALLHSIFKQPFEFVWNLLFPLLCLRLHRWTYARRLVWFLRHFLETWIPRSMTTRPHTPANLQDLLFNLPWNFLQDLWSFFPSLHLWDPKFTANHNSCGTLKIYVLMSVTTRHSNSKKNLYFYCRLERECVFPMVFTW